MLKKLLNTARIEFDIIPIDPMLIKSSMATVGGVDMSFVRTYKTGRPEPFIPGSSLKGMIRSYAEKICRSLKDKPVPVCLPYLSPGKEKDGEKHQASCGLRFDKYKKSKNIQTIPSTDIYLNSCAICKLFGSHEFIGRLSTSDGYLKPESKSLLEIRDGVAIDRITGGAAGGAKYDLEVLTRGEFCTNLEIRNFERWQLALIGLVLRDMCQGYVRLGFGKSRGLGRFKAEVKSFKIGYYNRNFSQLVGIYKLCTKEEQKQYGFFKESETDTSPISLDYQKGLLNEYDITDTWEEDLEPGVADFISMINESQWPNNLEQFVKGGR